MVYNLTYTGIGVSGIFEFLNTIFPLGSAILLLFLPFIIMVIGLLNYGLPTAFTTASFISIILSIFLVSTGLIDLSFMIIFIAFTIIGFIWMSAKR